MAKKTKDELKSVGLVDEQGDDGSSPPAESLVSPPTLGSAPTAAEAEQVAATATVTAPKAAKAVKPSVPLRVFAALSKVKPDQFQAFASYARREEMRPCPVPEWQVRYAAFLRKPVKGC